jgi:glucose/arabinose dehydrogenase
LLAKTPVVDSAIEIMSEEEQTLINATVEVRDGQTIMKFTKFLKEAGQIEIKMGVNNMLWAYGTSNTLSYHDQRSPFTLDLSSDVTVNTAAPSFESSVSPSYLSTQIDCNQPWPDAAWLQPNFCSSRFVDGLYRPRGLHIDHTNDEILVVERDASRVVRLVPNIDDAKSTGTIVPLSQTEGLGLNHGIELAGGYLYASSTTNVYRWPYVDGTAGDAEEVIVGMQSGGHFTRTLAFDADGKWLYVSIGSLNNADSDSSRSRIRRFDMSSWDGKTPFNYDDDGELFADGLRNEVGLAFDVHGDLWGVENGADNLQREDLGGDIHNDNPSEELNRFREDQAGQSWGYPYCWSEYCLPQENGGSGIKGANTRWAWPSFIDAGYTDEWCRENTNESAMSMPAHSAPLGMTFYKWKDLSQDESCYGGFPKSMDNYVFIAFHGSWNRQPPSGYKVVFVPMDNDGNPTHQPIDLFRHAGDGAKWPDQGIRPVDVQFDSCGRLYITEDKTGSVIQVKYGGSYLDNFEPIEKDVADGASCVAPEQFTTSSPTAQSGAPSSDPSRSESSPSTESSNEPSREPTPKLEELVQNLLNDTTNNSHHHVVWWPVHIIMLLLFQIL